MTDQHYRQWADKQALKGRHVPGGQSRTRAPALADHEFDPLPGDDVCMHVGDGGERCMRFASDHRPPTSRCPRCGFPPAMQLDPEQAFCSNEACDVLAWNPAKTREELEGDVTVIDASKWEQVGDE